MSMLGMGSCVHARDGVCVHARDGGVLCPC